VEFLKKLVETAGVPGREERVRDLILSEAKGLFDETRVDGMGNLICRKKPTRSAAGKDAPKVLLACHIDEIGFYVRSIDDLGRLRVQNVGGFDVRNLFARRVLVQGRRDLLGVMNPSTKPIHIASEEEKKKIPEIKDLYVDLFLSKEEVEKNVRIGDPITLVQTFEEIGDICNGKCMDNRVASWVAINALRRVQSSRYDIYYAATVQEEVGCRGAGPSSFCIDPEIGIAIDTTLACDVPGIDKTDAISELGKGVALKVMDAGSISHRGLLDEFIHLAEEKKIPYQLEILPMGRTDQASIHQARAGLKTITISIPTRYIHTVTESVHKKDLEAAVSLLAAWLSG
jgi:putative aminopeptidase FrvX